MHGSQAAAFEVGELAVPTIRWLGVHPSDASQFPQMLDSVLEDLTENDLASSHECRLFFVAVTSKVMVLYMLHAFNILNVSEILVGAACRNRLDVGLSTHPSLH